MNPTTQRLAVLAAVCATGVVAPVAAASAASPPAASARFALPFAGFPLPQLPAFTGVPLTFVGPSVGQVAAVIGPTILTTAPSTFNNTNIQVTAGGALGGGQFGP